jgi:arylsulfatase B/arylsulfatase I/J
MQFSPPSAPARYGAVADEAGVLQQQDADDEADGEQQLWTPPRLAARLVAVATGTLLLVLGRRFSSTPAVAAVDTARDASEHSAQSAGDRSSMLGGGQPNIVYVLVDDMGLNDVGYQSTDMLGVTPHMDQLAADGIKLDSYYAQSSCTPTRAALLTGKHASRTGLAHTTINMRSPYGLPLDHVILPQFLKKARGYSTHMIGKWDVGHFNDQFLPQQRGFDTFFGFYTSFTSYFEYVSEMGECKDPACYYDMHDNEFTFAGNGTYATDLFAMRAVQVIEGHPRLTDKTGHPLFLYFSPSAVHGPISEPSQAYVESLFGDPNQNISGRVAGLDVAIPTRTRRVFAAVLGSLDDAIGEIVAALERSGLYDDSLLIVASDNGAELGNVSYSNYGSNWPLRGRKGHLFEGGHRVPAFIHSPLIAQSARGRTFKGIFHVSDWVPTLVSGVLGSPSTLKTESIDGLDQMSALLGFTPPTRTELLYSVDACCLSQLKGAVRVGDWKLILHDTNETWWSVPQEQPLVSDKSATNSDIIHNQRYPHASLKVGGDDCGVYLFNLAEDPREVNNLAEARPDIVASLNATLVTHANLASACMFCGDAGSEAFAVWDEHDGFVVPWVSDANHMYTCQAHAICNGYAPANHSVQEEAHGNGFDPPRTVATRSSGASAVPSNAPKPPSSI